MIPNPDITIPAGDPAKAYSPDALPLCQRVVLLQQELERRTKGVAVSLKKEGDQVEAAGDDAGAAQLVERGAAEAARGTAGAVLVYEYFGLGSAVGVNNDPVARAALAGMVRGMREAADVFAALLQPAFQDPKALCPGHNPDKLTGGQVGVVKGWRLLEPSEVRRDRPGSYDLEIWDGDRWDNGSGWCGNSLTHTYRTKQPVGYFLTH